MNYEFFKPPYDPEFDVDPNEPFIADITPRTEKIINNLHQRYNMSQGQIAWEGLHFLKWSVDSVLEGGSILSAHFDAEEGEHAISPVLEAAQGKLDAGWLTRRKQTIELLKEGGISFGLKHAQVLTEIEEATRIESFGILLESGIFLLDWATQKTSNDGYVLAYNQAARTLGFRYNENMFPQYNPKILTESFLKVKNWQKIYVQAF